MRGLRPKPPNHGMHPNPPMQDLRGVDIPPTEAILLGQSLPGMQLILDSAEERWDPEYDYSRYDYVLEEMAWDEWGRDEDSRQSRH